MSPQFRSYAQQVVTNARVLAETLVSEGFRLVSGGTDNHLMLVDVGAMSVTGNEAEEALGSAGITVNKNAIPFDTRPPMVASGVRIGTPAVTTRGMKEPEMKLIGAWIARAIRERGSETTLKGIAGEVKELCASFALYPRRLSQSSLRAS